MNSKEDKFPKCARCLYATIGPSGKPFCLVKKNKRTKCPTYKKPNSTRYEFQMEGYRFIVTQINFYSSLAKEPKYVAWLNVYEEPYSKTKKRNPIYMAQSPIYTFEKSETKLKEMALTSFNSFYRKKCAEA